MLLTWVGHGNVEIVWNPFSTYLISYASFQALKDLPDSRLFWSNLTPAILSPYQGDFKTGILLSINWKTTTASTPPPPLRHRTSGGLSSYQYHNMVQLLFMRCLDKYCIVHYIQAQENEYTKPVFFFSFLGTFFLVFFFFNTKGEMSLITRNNT